MQYAYGGIFFISLLLLPIYFLFVRKKHDEPWMFVFCVCVSIVNLGYTLIAASKTVEFELLSITYLMSAGAFLAIWLMLSDYVHISELPPPIIVEEKALQS